MQSTLSYRDPIDWEDRALAPLGVRRQTTAWRAVIKAIYGSPLTADELVIYRRLSGGVDPPAGGHTRVLLVFGRRAGKTDASGLITAFEATQRPHDLHLGPKQVGVCGMLAQKLELADQPMNAARGYLTTEDPPARGKRKASQKYIANELTDEVQLRNGLAVQKLAATEKGVRGPTCVSVVADEVAAWDKIGPDSDEKVMGALLPSLVIEGDAPPRRFIAITSAGVKAGWAWRIFRDHFGKAEQPWLVLSGSSFDMRPSLESERTSIEAELAGRPGQFEREYLSVWGEEGSEAYFPSTIVKPCVTATCIYRTYQEGVRYFLAVDPAYKRDAFAIAVACSTRDLIPGDINQARRRSTHLVHVETVTPPKGVPLSAPMAARRVYELCLKYNVRNVLTDQHDPEALREALRTYGIGLVLRPWHSSPKPSDPKQKDRNPSKQERFSAVREAMIAEALTLPPNDDLLRELSQIVGEEQANASLKIYGEGRHDDRAHAAVLALSEALITSPSVATRTLTAWERKQQHEGARRLSALLGNAGRIGW